MDYSLISSVASGAKGLFDLARGIQTMTVDAEVKIKTTELIDKISSLQSQLLEIQIGMTQLHDEKVQLKKKLDEVDQWEIDVVPNYRLKELCSGVFVYAYHGPQITLADSEQPKHHLCAGCFASRRKSILQKKGYDISGALLECHSCGAVVHDFNDKHEFNIQSVQTRSKWDAFT